MKPKSLPSRLFDRNSGASSGETLSGCAAKYQRHVDCADHSERLDQPPNDDGQQLSEDSGQNEKWPREMHFAFAQEKYELLMDDEAKEEKKKRKKESYKKVKKVGVPLICIERTRVCP